MFILDEDLEAGGTDPDKSFVSNGEMNKSYVKDLVYFFNLYLGYVSIHYKDFICKYIDVNVSIMIHKI